MDTLCPPAKDVTGAVNGYDTTNWMESAMAKPRKTKDPHIQLFHEVIEGMAYAKLKPTEWQFIMVLWRLTYGRKNMTGQDGQWTPWSNAEWHKRTGMSRQNINAVKNSLMRKKVIKKKRTMIGFNKHFEQWDKGCSLNRLYSPDKLHSSNKLQVSSKQTTTVVQTDYKEGPKVKTSEEVQRLKKERKKETYSKDNIDDKNFNLFWEKYPKKGDSKKAARKAWDKHIKTVSPDQIFAALEIDMTGVFKDASGNKYLPGAGPWLNRERWEDLKVSPEQSRKEEMALEIRRLNMRYQSDPDMKRWDFDKLREQIINTYKEKK
jgi:hypothetical protein